MLQNFGSEDFSTNDTLVGRLQCILNFCRKIAVLLIFLSESISTPLSEGIKHLDHVGRFQDFNVGRFHYSGVARFQY